jgi:hypothetical protein
MFFTALLSFLTSTTLIDPNSLPDWTSYCHIPPNLLPEISFSDGSCFFSSLAIALYYQGYFPSLKTPSCFITLATLLRLRAVLYFQTHQDIFSEIIMELSDKEEDPRFVYSDYEQFIVSQRSPTMWVHDVVANTCPYSLGIDITLYISSRIPNTDNFSLRTETLSVSNPPAYPQQNLPDFFQNGRSRPHVHLLLHNNHYIPLIDVMDLGNIELKFRVSSYFEKLTPPVYPTTLIPKKINEKEERYVLCPPNSSTPATYYCRVLLTTDSKHPHGTYVDEKFRGRRIPLVNGKLTFNGLALAGDEASHADLIERTSRFFDRLPTASSFVGKVLKLDWQPPSTSSTALRFTHLLGTDNTPTHSELYRIYDPFDLHKSVTPPFGINPLELTFLRFDEEKDQIISEGTIEKSHEFKSVVAVVEFHPVIWVGAKRDMAGVEAIMTNAFVLYKVGSFAIPYHPLTSSPTQKQKIIIS